LRQGGGAKWPATADNELSVVGYLNKYKDSPAHFKVDEKPLVSTFEGVENIPDWAHGGPIRNLVGDIHFVPDWSSLGPDGIKQHLDKIEGAFSWDMWPNGPNDKDVGADEAWIAALGEGKDYMMGVSPWFFRSAEGGKNWIWKGDDLWTQRWAQAATLKPRFVQ
jgi:glucan endo-1,3-alpha-glucosidase